MHSIKVGEGSKHKQMKPKRKTRNVKLVYNNRKRREEGKKTATKTFTIIIV